MSDEIKGRAIEMHVPLLANGAYPIQASLLGVCDVKFVLDFIRDNMHKCFVLEIADYDPENRKLHLLFKPGNGCQTVLLPPPKQKGGEA